MGSKKPTPPPKAVERFHPGVYIREEMDARGWSIETMVEKSSISRDAIEEIIAGARSVTPIIAMCLGNAFGTSDQIWRNLQKAFDDEPRPTSPPPPPKK